MIEVRNLKNKRVCDISPDRKAVEIVRDGCVTRITVARDGTLEVENRPLKKTA